MTRRKAPHEKQKPGPKPGFQRSPSTPGASIVTQDIQAQAPPRFEDTLQKGRNIDLMPEGELRAYARQLGMTPRDAESLGVERLRVNCHNQIYALIEDL